MHKPLVLVILDGWGYSDTAQYNAINQAYKPNWDLWWQTMPHVLLDASGLSVGLPNGQMGNSEVGHMHIGSGKVIYQELTKINEAVKNNTFANNQEFLSLLDQLKASNHYLHILGLLSPGGVHAHEDHLFALLDKCRELNFHNVVIHPILDGRDTPPRSAKNSLEKLVNYIKIHNCFSVGSICGRYYAMDRDQRWDRTGLAIKALIEGGENVTSSPIEALEYSYKNNIFDEFVLPTHIANTRLIQNGDAVFFCNFRADRARQITSAFVKPYLPQFQEYKIPAVSAFWSMTEYANDLPTFVLFPADNIKTTLGSVVSTAGLQQLRIAETEKYAHVTFFLNGGREEPYLGEDRILIPSPKVKTYDLLPEMSAKELTHKLLEAIDQDLYSLIIVNYANADMVGHTGDFEATKKAINVLDECLGLIYNKIKQKDGVVLITADHGNAEFMYDTIHHQPHTAHTNNLVPFLCLSDNIKYKSNVDINYHGTLIDIAPTVLNLLNLPIPHDMQGKQIFCLNTID